MIKAESLARRALSSEAEIVAEIKSADIAVGNDFRGLAVGQHLAGVNDIGAVDHAERLAHIVVGDQYPDAALRQVTDKPLDIGDRNRVDAGKGFVQQHEGRVGGQRQQNVGHVVAVRRRLPGEDWQQHIEPAAFEEELAAAAFEQVSQPAIPPVGGMSGPESEVLPGADATSTLAFMTSRMMAIEQENREMRVQLMEQSTQIA